MPPARTAFFFQRCAELLIPGAGHPKDALGAGATDVAGSASSVRVAVLVMEQLILLGGPVASSLPPFAPYLAGELVALLGRPGSRQEQKCSLSLGGTLHC